MRRFGPFPTFLVGSALVIAAVTTATGLVVAAVVERHLLELAYDQTAAFVISEARQHVPPDAFDAGPAPRTAETFQSFLSELPGIFRIKVFDSGGQIIWSDKPELIGRTFADNPPFRRAIAGERVAIMGAPKRAEHVYERDRPAVVEIYVPITFANGGRVTGVIEAYRDATTLVAAIAVARHRTWVVSGLGALVAYVALAGVAWRAARAEARAIARLQGQNRELAAIQDYTQAILEPVELRSLAARIVQTAARNLSVRRVALYRVGPDDALSLLADAGAAASPGEAGDAALATVASGRAVFRGSVLAFPLSPRKDSRYVLGVDLARGTTAADVGTVRVLEIMVQEASIALANAELFAEVSQAHEHLATVLSGVTDRMTILDRDMRLVWANQPGPDACAESPGARVFRSGRPERGRRAVHEPDGTVRYLDVVAAPLPDGAGAVPRVLEVARDITEIVEMEERLRESSARLEAKNRELIAVQAQLAARERLAAIGEVTVGLHHAVLNPLAGIAGALDVLEHGDATPDTRAAVFDEVRAALGKIEHAVRRLETLRRASGTIYVGDTRMLDLERPADVEAGQTRPDD